LFPLQKDCPSAKQAHSLDNEPSDNDGCANKQQKVTNEFTHTGPPFPRVQ